jgi:hypothetical protein
MPVCGEKMSEEIRDIRWVCLDCYPIDNCFINEDDVNNHVELFGHIVEDAVLATSIGILGGRMQ